MVKAKTRSKNRKQNRTHKFHGKANISTMAMRAVSNDGSNWHVDTDINGVKKSYKSYKLRYYEYYGTPRT